MSIRPIYLNGMIQRTDDVGQLKLHEDQKPMADQQAIQGQMTHKEEQAAHEVIGSQEGAAAKNHADAREEGKNKYTAVRGKKRKKEPDGQVVRKTPSGIARFDLKI